MESVAKPHPASHAGSVIWILVAGIAALGLAALAIAVRGGPLPLDLAIRSTLGVGAPVPPLLVAMNAIGGAIVWDVGVAVIAIGLWVVHARAAAASLALGVLGSEALATAIKLVVDRPRPAGVAVEDLVTQASFPSGHVTRAVVTFGLLVLVWPGGPRSRFAIAGLGVVVAILMGLARIESGEHWPTDVLGGYLLTMAVLAVMAAAWARLRTTRSVDPGGPIRGRTAMGR